MSTSWVLTIKQKNPEISVESQMEQYVIYRKTHSEIVDYLQR